MVHFVGAPGLLTEEQVEALVGEAATAVDRGTPGADRFWSWRSTRVGIDLWADPSVQADSGCREKFLAGGAVLLTLRVLIKGLGMHTSLRLLPDPKQRDLIATIRVEGPRPVTEQDRSLVTAALSGTPNAPTVGQVGVHAAQVSALRRAARVERAWLAVQPLSAVLTATSADGAARSRGVALIVGTVLDGPSAHLQAGQAAQRVWLTATTLGVPLARGDHLMWSSADRRAVRQVIGGGLWPQALLQVTAEEQPGEQSSSTW